VKKSSSYFVAGLMVGLVVATVAFSLLLRSKNLQATGGGRLVLKLSHVLDQTHPVHTAMEYMAERLAEKSGGTVIMKVFPSGQLGGETDSIEQLQRGAIAMTKTSTSVMEGFIPEMAVFGIPYIFRDSEHYWKVLDGELGKMLLHLGEVKKLRGLCYYDSGSRNFYTVEKPILSPDDLKGMKIRVMKSKTAMDTISALGGSPTPIPWGELYTALQQKMVDGAENNPPSFYTNRHFEVCKYFSFDEHTRIPDILLISQIVWESLTPQQQTWVQEAADESSVFQRKLWKEKTDEAIEETEKEGVKFYYPDKKPFVEKVKAMHQSYDDNEKIAPLLKRIKETE